MAGRQRTRLIALVRAGVRFERSQLVERPEAVGRETIAAQARERQMQP
jgi:hypothetical protein